jgi:hypothetical protein
LKTLIIGRLAAAVASSCNDMLAGAVESAQICAATSFLALWRSNSPFSTPPIRLEFS